MIWLYKNEFLSQQLKKISNNALQNSRHVIEASVHTREITCRENWEHNSDVIYVEVQ